MCSDHPFCSAGYTILFKEHHFLNLRLEMISTVLAKMLLHFAHNGICTDRGVQIHVRTSTYMCKYFCARNLATCLPGLYIQEETEEGRKQYENISFTEVDLDHNFLTRSAYQIDASDPVDSADPSRPKRSDLGVHGDPIKSTT